MLTGFPGLALSPQRRIHPRPGRSPIHGQVEMAWAGPLASTSGRNHCDSTQRRAVNPAEHRVRTWLVLGFEAVQARSSDFTPGSPDLSSVLGVLDQLWELPLPPVARDWPETRWNRFARDGESEVFRGNTLLHTDIAPSNVIIGEGRAWAVDWAWPTRGAAFIDPACLVVQLVAAGHSVARAEAWAAECQGWATADSAAIDAFALAALRMYQWRADRSPEAIRVGDRAQAARQWAVHRNVAPTD